MKVPEGLLFINEKDVFLEYGIFLHEDESGTHNNYNELLELCSGMRDVTLQFALLADTEQGVMSRYTAFISLLTSDWLDVRLPELSRTFRMHYEESSGYKSVSYLEDENVYAILFRIKFHEQPPTIEAAMNTPMPYSTEYQAISDGLLVENGITTDSIYIKSKETMDSLSQAIIENETNEVMSQMLVEDAPLGVLSSLLSEEAATGNTIGNLDNVNEAADNAPAGSVLVMGDDLMYHPDTSLQIDIEQLMKRGQESFIDISVSENNIIVDHSQTPYSKVTLSGDTVIHNLSIINTKNGDKGKVLVFQTNFKQIAVASNIKAYINLPLGAGTACLLSYNVVGNTIYMHSNWVIGNETYSGPQKIEDFILVSSNSNSATVQWTAPQANNPREAVTEYDMRYSNNSVNADDPSIWAGLKQISGLPIPAEPGILQKMSLNRLTASKDYYVYLKSVKVNYGVAYPSVASECVHFRTTGADNPGKPYRLNLTEDNIITQLRVYNTDTDGTLCTPDRMVDEMEKITFLENGYPDTTKKDLTTFWQQFQWRPDTSPFHIDIDLLQVHNLDRFYVFTRSKLDFSVYVMKDLGYDWEKVDEIHIVYNDWGYIELRQMEGRFLRIMFDLDDFGYASNPSIPTGSEGFPDPEYNGTVNKIECVMIYGRPKTVTPEGIQAPVRSSRSKRTVDQFFCVNGHAYQQGRIHSLCSGALVRSYIHYGHFDEHEIGNSIADLKFNVNDVLWVSGNNGDIGDLQTTLETTWKKYGLKPYLTSEGAPDRLRYKKEIEHCRWVDSYWYPNAWRPIPSRGVGGRDKYFVATENPTEYRTLSKLCYALAAKYGKNQTNEDLFYESAQTTGLDLISGLEPNNEPDQSWSSWIGYSHDREEAAYLSATLDGHDNTLQDEDGNYIPGVKFGDILSLTGGLATVNRGYYQGMLHWWLANRLNGKNPADVWSVHMYFSNIGSQENSNIDVQHGITFEDAMKGETGKELPKLCKFRDQFSPDTQIFLNEFAWGEAGAPNSQSPYQCYSLPGRYIGSWLLPDRHRSDVKGAWTVRATIQMMHMGVDLVNYFSTESSAEYYDVGDGGGGAGVEMHHWNDISDITPGAKVAHVKQYECPHARGYFSATGLFGHILYNGAYPITRSYWWVATMRNRLKGYILTGMKYLNDSKIVIACFKKEGEEKGAYAVYYNDSQNTGVSNVSVPLPAGVTKVTKVETYVPEIPNPRNVPNTIGCDQDRTGLPTSRYERYDGTQWVVTNKEYMPGKTPSYTNAPANYPSSPKAGDEVITIPTEAENPYFPIVGPVCAQRSKEDKLLWALDYQYQEVNDGVTEWKVSKNNQLAWRQVNAICDYIELHPEGKKGAMGIESDVTVVNNTMIVNVSEFPEYYFFDAVPDPDFKSEVENVSAVPVSDSSIDLYWNNTNNEDTGYQVFMSNLPETGYTLLKTVGLDADNKTTVSGLLENTIYYFKIRPVNDGKTGTLSDYIAGTTQTSALPLDSQIIEVSITVPPGNDISQITASMPVLKYNKKMIFNYTADDGPVGAYGKVYRYASGKWVDNEQYFHVGQAKTTGYIPEHGIGYTDGCGVVHRMPVGVAIWPNCGNSYTQMFMDHPIADAGKYYPYIIWNDLTPILDFNGDIYYHNVNERVWSKTDPSQVLQGLKADNTKAYTNLGRHMKIMMRPDGNNVYLTASETDEDIVMMWAEGDPSIPVYPKSDTGYYKITAQRYMYTDDNTYELARIREIHDSSNPMWYNLFTHTPSQEFLDLLGTINNTYGKDGDDSLWMATCDEVYEYQFIRKNTTIDKIVKGNVVTFRLSIPIVPDFNHKDLSLNINGLANTNGISLTSNEQVYGLSYHADTNNVLINVNYNEKSLQLLEKYTSKFETSKDVEDMKDALYLSTLTKSDLAAPYINRINALVQPLAINSITFEPSEAHLTKKIRFDIAGIEIPTHYILSENSNFSDTSWTTYINPASYTFSSLGSKTLYAKVKTSSKESSVVSKNIEISSQKLIVSLNFQYVVDALGTGSLVCNEVYNDETINIIRDSFDEIQLKDTNGANFGKYRLMTHRSESIEQPQNGTGVYPFKYIATAFGYTMWNQPSPIVPCNIGFILPEGIYKVRILGSTSYEGTNALNTLFYEANGITVNAQYDIRNNYTQFTEIDNVVVGSDGYLTLKYWSNPTRGNKVAVNLVEIIKES